MSRPVGHGCRFRSATPSDRRVRAFTATVISRVVLAILLVAVCGVPCSGQQPGAGEPSVRSTKRAISANRAIQRRLLRGDKESQLKTIANIRQRQLDDPGVLLALIEGADRILESGEPDTRVFLIVETIGLVPEADVGRTALLRWLDLALEQAVPEDDQPWSLLSHTVLVALRRDAHEAVQQRAVDLLNDKDVRLRILAIDILGRQRYAPALPSLIAALDSEPYRNDYGFRYALIEALAQYPQPEAQEALLGQLPRLSGQIRQRLAQHRQVVAGQAPLPPTLEIENRALRRRAPVADGDPDSYRYLTTRAPEYPLTSSEEDYRVPRFMGVPIYADRVTFVIDFSSTMAQPSGRAGTRLDAAKRELQQVIRQLPAEKSFRVIGFDGKVVPLSPTLVPATPRNKEAVMRELDYLRNGHWTNLFGGLQAALLDPGHPELVILLSDGLPTRGEFTADEEILRAIGYTNLFRRITIETISVGRDSVLMKRLALQNGGATRRVN